MVVSDPPCMANCYTLSGYHIIRIEVLLEHNAECNIQRRRPVLKEPLHWPKHYKLYDPFHFALIELRTATPLTLVPGAIIVISLPYIACNIILFYMLCDRMHIHTVNQRLVLFSATT